MIESNKVIKKYQAKTWERITMQEINLVFKKNHYKVGVVAHVCSLSTKEAEAERLQQVQGQPGLESQPELHCKILSQK